MNGQAAPEVPGRLVEIRPGRRVSLAVNEGTRRDETAVFLCHGAGGAKAQWRNQWRALTALGYRVVAWDFAGHGETPRSPRAEDYSGEAFVADYLAVLEGFALERNLLVGHSYGARLTLRVLCDLAAGGRSDLAMGAVLLGAPAPAPAFGGGPIATWPVPLLNLLRPWLSRGFVRAAWSRSTDATLIRREERASRRNSLFMMQSLMRGAVRLDPQAIAKLDLPALVIAGEEDQLTPPAAGKAVADLLANARFEIFAACGHQIMLEQPERTTERILAALEPAA